MDEKIEKSLTGSEASDIAVRKATAADADLLLRLIIGLAEFEKLPPPDEAAQKRLVADAFGAQPRFDVYLAEVGQTAVGYAFVFETYSTFLAMPTLYLEDLFVLPDFRGQRVGYALMQYLAGEAIKRGCGRMEWVVLDWNSHAIRFYDRLGGRNLNDWLPYRLDPEGLQRLAAADK